MHVIRADGEVIRAGRSVLYIYGVLGWPGMRVLASRPMVWFVELGYWFVSRNRLLASRVFFRVDHDG